MGRITQSYVLGPKTLAAVVLSLFLLMAFTPMLPSVSAASSGSVHLTIGGQGSISWSMTGIHPGDSGVKEVILQNVGDQDGYITLWISDVQETDGSNDGAALAKYLQFDVKADGLNTSLQFPSTLYQLPSYPSSVDQMVIGPVQAGHSVTVNWYWDFVETGTSQNDAQGDGLTFNINYLLASIPPVGDKYTWIVFDMLGKETTVGVNSTGFVQETIEVSDPSNIHHFDIYQGTRILTADGKIPSHLIMTVDSDGVYPDMPNGTVEIGPKYKLSGFTEGTNPADVFFYNEAILTMGFDQSAFPQGYTQSMILMLTSNGNWTEMIGWAGMTSTSWEATGRIDRTGIYAIVAANGSFGRGAFISSSSLVITPSITDLWAPFTLFRSSGESASVSVILTNLGNSEGTYYVSLMIDGRFYDSRLVDFQPGESRQVTLNATGLSAGPHDIRVAGITGSFSTDSMINWPLIILIIVVACISTWTVDRRRRRTPRSIHDAFIKDLNIKVVRPPPKRGKLASMMGAGRPRKMSATVLRDYQDRVMREVSSQGQSFDRLAQATSIESDQLTVVLERLYNEGKIEVRSKGSMLFFVAPGSEVEGNDAVEGAET